MHRWIIPAALFAGIAAMAAGLPAGHASSLALTSPAFASSAAMPSKYTCDGRGVSPPLAWQGVPAGTRSLVLIEDDPDAPDPAAPQRTWVHWLLYDLPPTSHGLPEAVAPSALPAGTRTGRNDWGTVGKSGNGYGAPCPPTGRHRYVHKLYALDVQLGNLHGPDKSTLEVAMRGHVIAHAELVGTYEKQR